MDQMPHYHPGDQIVHRAYGIGRVAGIEIKSIAGKNKAYYRVEIQDGAYFIPLEHADNSRVRPLASPENIEQALLEASDLPDGLADDYRERRQLINEVLSAGNLLPTASLIRDLYARKVRHKLTDAESQALDTLQRKVVLEMTACLDISEDEAHLSLLNSLQLAVQKEITAEAGTEKKD
jgi:RNA polymerase-interacting CarD/CdnL/TRCF family regulator